MGDLEQRVYVVQINIPEAKDLGLLGMRGGQIDAARAIGHAKEELLVAPGSAAVRQVPGPANLVVSQVTTQKAGVGMDMVVLVVVVTLVGVVFLSNKSAHWRRGGCLATLICGRFTRR